MCDKCGLRIVKDGQNHCYKTRMAITEQKESCGFFIAVQYDGEEPHSPEEHLYFLKSELEAKKMKNMQGLRL